MNKTENRPGEKGDKENTNQYVHIVFVGIKCCGKPGCFECGV